MVTAELAAAMPVLVVFAFVGVVAVGVVQARVRCADAAWEAARAIARGDARSASGLATKAAGKPVDVSSVNAPDLTTVTVRMRIRPIRWLAMLTVTESAVVAREPTGRSAEARAP